MAERSPTPDWIPERLEKLQELQAEQQRLRAAQPDCPHGNGTSFFQYYTVTGEARLYLGCVDCRALTEGGKWRPGPVPPDTPVGLDNRFQQPPCARCGHFGTELHHFAPKAIFGIDEAELWPTAYLCQGCHNYWHRAMATTQGVA